MIKNFKDYLESRLTKEEIGKIESDAINEVSSLIPKDINVTHQEYLRMMGNCTMDGKKFKDIMPEVYKDIMPEVYDEVD